MIRVVLDTNVLVSAFITGKGNEWTILDKIFHGKLELAVSDKIIEEFVEVISRPKFGYTKTQIESMKMLVFQASHIVLTSQKLDIIQEDPADNRILECAVEAKADYILSGDQHLLKLRKYKGIKILNSADFLKRHS